jgi:hypothetical protein
MIHISIRPAHVATSFVPLRQRLKWGSRVHDHSHGGAWKRPVCLSLCPGDDGHSRFGNVDADRSIRASGTPSLRACLPEKHSIPLPPDRRSGRRSGSPRIGRRSPLATKWPHRSARWLRFAEARQRDGWDRTRSRATRFGPARDHGRSRPRPDAWPNRIPGKPGPAIGGSLPSSLLDLSIDVPDRR